MSDETTPETTPEIEDGIIAADLPEEAPEPRSNLVDLSSIKLNLHATEAPTDLLAVATEMVAQACSKFAMRDQISYLVGTAMVPTPDQGLIPVLSVTVSIPSLVISQPVQGTVMIQDLFVTQEAIDHVVPEILATLRTARIQQAGNLDQSPNGMPPNR